MPDTTYPPIDWKAFRFALDQLNRSVASLTDALEALYNTTDQPDAQVLTLEFGTTSTIVCVEPATRNLPSRDEYPRQRSPWSYDEEQALRSALLLGFDAEWIGHRLNRTAKAVQRKIDRMRAEGMML